MHSIKILKMYYESAVRGELGLQKKKYALKYTIILWFTCDLSVEYRRIQKQLFNYLQNHSLFTNFAPECLEKLSLMS